jgi:tetratricopeptide (TPR) repeat protein
MTFFMITSWLTALRNYNYYANLAEYENRDQYSDGFTKPSFTATIDSSNTKIFEEAFRTVIEAKLYSKYSIVGEVCYWKLFKKPDPNSLTTRMLHLLENQEKFLEFCINLHNLSENPTLNNFKKFRHSCGQSNGFAVPITFLSFYRSSQYPMADAYVSLWWNKNKSKFGYGSSNDFIPKGRISGEAEYIDHNWGAYGQWTHFCQKYSLLLTSKTQTIWRARDVEMAIFYNQQKGGILLNNLDENASKFDNKNEFQKPQQLKTEILSYTNASENPELKKEAQQLFLNSISLQNEKRWYEALKKCELAVQLDPTNLNILQNIAFCLQKLSRYDDERKCYLKILDDYPNNQNAKIGLNICVKRLNIYRESQHSQQLESEIFSNTIVSKNPELKKDGHRLLVKAISLQNENHWPEALKNCESAVKLDPTNPNIWLNMALCLQKLNRYEDERKCYLKILDNDPNNQHAKMGLHICLKRLNKHEEAELYNPFLDNDTNYAPKQYPYWSDGGGRR